MGRQASRASQRRSDDERARSWTRSLRTSAGRETEVPKDSPGWIVLDAYRSNVALDARHELVQPGPSPSTFRTPGGIVVCDRAVILLSMSPGVAAPRVAVMRLHYS